MGVAVVTVVVGFMLAVSGSRGGRGVMAFPGDRRINEAVTEKARVGER